LQDNHGGVGQISAWVNLPEISRRKTRQFIGSPRIRITHLEGADMAFDTTHLEMR